VGSELLTEEVAPPTKTYTEQFYEVFPFYLSIGMTYELFWLKDATLTRYYRKAYEMQRERANYDAWLQGAYIYDALCAVSPVLHAFAKSGTKPIPYHKEPYGTKKSDAENTKNIDAEVGAAKFFAFASQFNKKFENKTSTQGGGLNGNDNRPASN